VLYVAVDAEDDAERVLGVAKSNLGRLDIPMKVFTIVGAHVADTDEGPVWSSRIEWGADRPQSIREVLEANAESTETRTATGEAAEWLLGYLTSQGGIAESSEVQAQARRQGHAESTVKRARQRLGVISKSSGGFQRSTTWSLPGTQPDDPPVGSSQVTCPGGV